MSLCAHGVLIHGGLLPSMVLTGLVGGFTHCMWMCGPFVLAQQKPRTCAVAGLCRLKNSILISYHIGRLTTYVLLAIVANMAFHLIFINPIVAVIGRAVFLLLAAVMFLAAAFPLIRKMMPWTTTLSLPVPFQFIQSRANQLVASEQVWHRYLLGMLLGALPCGLVLAALFATTAADTPWQAGIAMAAFGIATVPALWVVGLGAQWAQSQWPARVKAITPALNVCSSLWLLFLIGKLALS